MSLNDFISSKPSSSSLAWFSQLEDGQCSSNFIKANPSIFSQRIANAQVNRKKNRYTDILAYDSTRVKLNGSENVEDYINANFVEYPNIAKYIAAQAPLPDTIGDFWQMVWEQQCPAIVVLTKEQEGYKLKYHRYCPLEANPLTFTKHGIQVECDTAYTSPSSQYIQYRRYIISRPGSNEPSRTVIQLKFEEWPDHGTPSELQPFVDLLESVRRIQSESPLKGPPVVHCSAGCGRTGTFCVIDTVLKLLPLWTPKQQELEGDIIRHVVHTYRQQRPFFVQTSSQFKFLYFAIYQIVNNFKKLL